MNLDTTSNLHSDRSAWRPGINVATHEFKCYGQARRKVNIKEMLPKDWELPKELFEINLPCSSSKIVNFCDSMVRK